MGGVDSFTTSMMMKSGIWLSGSSGRQLRSDYVALGRRKEGCEDGCPWTEPYVLDDRWVCGVVLQHSPGDHVEGHIFLSNSHKLALLIIVLGYGPKYTAGA